MKIVSVPYSGGSLGKNDGCDEAPKVLVSLLQEKTEFVVDQADVSSNDVESLKVLEKVEGDIFVGGDHSLTYYTFKKFSENFLDVGLVVFDAHPDCYDSNEVKNPLHEDFLYHLIKNGCVDGKNVMVIGARSIDPKEMEFMKKKGVIFYTSHEVISNVEDVCERLVEFMEKQKNVYLSVDIDVIDPSHAPGTGYVEENGLGKGDLFLMLDKLKGGCVRRFDLVEINPSLDKDEMTVSLGVDILLKFLEFEK